MGSLGEAGVRDFGNPVLIELNRVENLLKEKERELGVAQNEIKALKGTEFLKDKAVVEGRLTGSLLIKGKLRTPTTCRWIERGWGAWSADLLRLNPFERSAGGADGRPFEPWDGEAVTKNVSPSHGSKERPSAPPALRSKGFSLNSNELSKLEQKLRTAEKQTEDKVPFGPNFLNPRLLTATFLLTLSLSSMQFQNLEIKRLIDEKKAALSSQFAAESTLRRMHAGQKDDDAFSPETLIAPLEAEIKMCRTEIASLREDRKAADRLMKSKEIALVEIEKNMNAALERALMVENLQNQNDELKRQVEICQEENKFLEKTNRQKIIEVDKLTQTIRDLEECILVGGQTANVVRDYERQVTELNEERKLLMRELAKANICANRVATVVANEWKDEGEKVMPVKQWLEERRFLQGEIQRLKDKLIIAERSSRAEAKLKDKIKLRLRTLEENFKQKSTSSVTQITNSDPKLRISSPNIRQKRSLSQPRASASKVSVNRSVDDPKTLQGSNRISGKLISSKNMVRGNLCASTSKMYDEGEKENIVKKINRGDYVTQENVYSKAKTNEHNVDESETTERQGDCCNDDMISGFLYDRLQKEIIALRKSQDEKDEKLSAREVDIKLLQRKIEALTKAMEMDSKNMRRAAAVREKEIVQKSEATERQNKTNSMIRSRLTAKLTANRTAEQENSLPAETGRTV
ncbi:Microtubule-associated protein 70-5 [Platanthera zijinensis]|uniref:Microtubule-associated protein 70-5 n=1 Tax=Platanthera zijinensis TaxID=2320716 RepID=A0AAP0BEM6_9ASPA